MAAVPKRIKVTPSSELTEILNEAKDGPVVLEHDGERYRVDWVEHGRDELWQGYDAEKVREAIDKFAGIWSDRDADAMIERIYQARKEGSRPADRP
jgi:hypothetical protein